MKIKALIAGTVASSVLLGFITTNVEASVQSSNNYRSNILSQANKNKSTTYSVTDEEYVQLLKQNGQYEAANAINEEIKKENKGISTYKIHNGTNSVTLTGKGAVVVKISGTVAKGLSSIGVATGGAAVSMLAAKIPGWGKIAGVLGTTAATTLLNQVTQNSIKGGAWVKIGLKSKKVLGQGWQ